MTSRKSKTAIDYIIIGLNPTLIVLMIASLVYFLTLCFYHGRFVNQINWILLLFTIAAVGIARIAIEQGRAHAAMFAVALGGATLVSTARFIGEGMPLVVLLLILIWYLADRITIDCTLIDEGQDASGEGLLQGGLFGAAKQSESPDVSLDGTTGLEDAPLKRRTHRPGIWILYLAAAAVPLYGLGQLLLPDTDVAGRRALISLAIYLASSLLLLVTTSFLGMRRYLRQRGADMPAAISINWLGLGAVLVTVLLFVSFFLPLPGQMLASIDGSSITMSQDQEASRWGWGDEGIDSDRKDAAKAPEGEEAKKSKRPGGKQPSKEQGPDGTQPGGKKGEQGQGTGEKSDEGKSSGGDQKGKGKGSSQDEGDEPQKKSKNGKPKKGSKSGKDKPSEKGDPQSGKTSGKDEPSENGKPQSKQQSGRQEPSAQGAEPQTPESAEQSAEEEGGSASETPPPASEPWQMPDIVSQLGGLLKYLIFAILAGILVFYAMRHWDQLARWWHELLGLWNRTEDTTLGEPEAPSRQLPPSRPFSSFRNPLNDPSIGMHRAVVTTFSALSAWARENDCDRRPETTPTEFARQLAIEFPENSIEITAACELYNDTVYGGAKISGSHRPVLANLWAFMQTPQSRPEPVEPVSEQVTSKAPKWKY